jgi:PCI domain
LDKWDKQLAKFTPHLIRMGTYLNLERCRSLVIRALFKNVYKLVGTTRIAFSVFKTALELSMKTDVEMDAVECWLVNMIDKGTFNSN